MTSSVLSVIACVAVGYACGSLPWGLWLGQRFRGVDVRTLGSGNLGATNVFRSLGRGLGIATLLLDVLKGAARRCGSCPRCRLPSGVPRRRYGVQRSSSGSRRSPATCGRSSPASRAARAWRRRSACCSRSRRSAFLAFVVVFVATVALTRYISLGSVLGAVAFALVLGFQTPTASRRLPFVFGVLAAALVIWRHRENLARARAPAPSGASWHPAEPLVSRVAVLGAGLVGHDARRSTSRTRATTSGCGADRADELRQIEADRENRKFLPGIRLPAGVKVQPELEAALAGVEFIAVRGAVAGDAGAWRRARVRRAPDPRG